MIIALAILHTFLQLCDWHLTSEILKRGGREENSSVYGTHPTFWRVGVPKLAAIAGGWLITLAPGPAPAFILGLLCMICLIVVGHNYQESRK